MSKLGTGSSKRRPISVHGRVAGCASKGLNFDDAEFLRVKSTDLNVKMLHTFRIGDLRDRYERVTPCLQVILKAVVGKTEPEHADSRNPDMASHPCIPHPKFSWSDNI